MTKKNKEISSSNLIKVKPITEKIRSLFLKLGNKERISFLFGCAGTGKTFVSLYLAMQDVL